MNRNRFSPRAALALSTLCTSLGGHAAGFALIEHNASGLGNAYAGAAALASDASTIWFNPAGMRYLPEQQAVVAGHLILPKIEFDGTASVPVGVGEGGDAGSLAFVPNAYYSRRVAPDLTLGVGLNAPFGLRTEWDETWIGRVHGVESDVKSINLNPSLAWAVSDTVSIGAGVNLLAAAVTLTSFDGVGTARIKGDDVGVGANLGVLWQATPAVRVGLAWRSDIELEVEGDARLPSLGNATLPVYADVTLPGMVSASVVWQASPAWQFLADVSRTNWSEFDELRVQIKANDATLALTPQNFVDTNRYSLGVNYRVNDRLTLRAGVAYDETPVRDEFRTVRIPDNDRTWLAVGVQVRLSPASAVDIGYAHLFLDSAPTDRTDSGVRLAGEFNGAIDVLGVQYTHSF